MKNQITLSNLLLILTSIIIPLLLWGIRVETRLTSMNLKEKQNEKKISQIWKSIKEIKDDTNEILIELKSLEHNVN